MSIYQGQSKRKVSGGRYRSHRKKKKYELGRDPLYTHIGETKRKIIRTRGGNTKVKLLKDNMANVKVLKKNKIQRVKITTVKENIADPNYVQRNIITKGALIETELGVARVTSRPGQDGVINAILIK